jgi:hypothetical protein
LPENLFWEVVEVSPRSALATWRASVAEELRANESQRRRASGLPSVERHLVQNCDGSEASSSP